MALIFATRYGIGTRQQIYVKVIPPSRGTLDACVMLFDSPADPRNIPGGPPGLPNTKMNRRWPCLRPIFKQKWSGPESG